MEQKEPTVATVEIERMRPCINEDEECSWSGDEGCLCYPDPDKWVPVAESGEEHYLQDYWSSLATEEAFYLPKTVKVLIKGDVKEMPIEWLLQKRVEVPKDFGKPKPPVPCDLPGQVLMYEKIVPEEAVAYYYATEGSDQRIDNPGINYRQFNLVKEALKEVLESCHRETTQEKPPVTDLWISMADEVFLAFEEKFKDKVVAESKGKVLCGLDQTDQTTPELLILHIKDTQHYKDLEEYVKKITVAALKHGRGLLWCHNSITTFANCIASVFVFTEEPQPAQRRDLEALDTQDGPDLEEEEEREKKNPESQDRIIEIFDEDTGECRKVNLGEALDSSVMFHNYESGEEEKE